MKLSRKSESHEIVVAHAISVSLQSAGQIKARSKSIVQVSEFQGNTDAINQARMKSQI
jgi:hypothetical protein